jgi:hypothetical protein
MIVLRNFYKSVMYLLVHAKLLHTFGFQSIRIGSDLLVLGNENVGRGEWGQEKTSGWSGHYFTAGEKKNR